jgi:TonB dependent receptor-like, beta-barrel/TonB-dependent Receptor Plug Domain
VRSSGTAVLLALLLAATAGAEQAPGPYAGRLLEDVLRDLQSRGLRILFSSDLVKPTMRVQAEPRAMSPRLVLDEILRPHGLEAQPGPGGRLLVVRAPRPVPSSSPSPPPPRFRESVQVSADVGSVDAGPTTLVVQPRQVEGLAGAAENVFRALQTLPGVSGVDDVDSRLSVRGGSPDENLTVVDGVEIHDPYRLEGLVSAFNPELVERFEFAPGAFDVSHGDRLSSLLVVENRAGTRDRGLAGSAGLSITDANAVLEGRLPGGRSGSWLVAGRRTYLDLIGNRFSGVNIPNFGDLQSKVVWEPSPGKRLSLFGLYGRERTDYGVTNSTEDFVILTRAGNGLAGLSFESNLGASAFLRTQASFYRFSDLLDFHGAFESDALRSFGGPETSRVAQALFVRDVTVDDLAFRSELLGRVSGRHVVEAGLEAHALSTRWGWQVGGDRSEGTRNGLRLPYPSGLAGTGLPDQLDSAADYARAGAWLQDRFQLTRGVALQGGVRADWSGVNHETTVSPRLSATASLSADTRLRAAVGIHRQSPGYEKLFLADYFVDLSRGEAAALRSEKAVHFVLGLERDFGSGHSLRVEGYRRQLSLLLVGRLETPDEVEARLVSYDFPPFPTFLQAEVPREPQITSIPVNGASGVAQGLELTLSRLPMTGRRLSGWLAYGLGSAERDAYGRRYPFDYARRHAVVVVAEWRPSDRLTVAATGRVASGFPYTPAIGVRVAAVPDAEDRDGDGNRTELIPARDDYGNLEYTADFGGVSNLDTGRLPTFARLDLRATYLPKGRAGRWQVYLDLINVLGRQNAGRINSVVVPGSDPDRPTIEEQRVFAIPFLPSLGVRFRF